MHHIDFGGSDVFTNGRLQHLVVLGGAKSAADIAYSAANAGKTVSWIIRKSGSGPAAFVNAKGIGPYRFERKLIRPLHFHLHCKSFLRANLADEISLAYITWKATHVVILGIFRTNKQPLRLDMIDPIARIEGMQIRNRTHLCFGRMTALV
jgi:hypothetical protein